MSRNAFPLGKFRDRYAEAPSGVVRALRARIEQVLVPIRLAPRSWMETILGSAPSAGDRRRILESFADTEIWSCLGATCRGCPGNESAGCAMGARVSGGMGTVLLAHPCLYGQGACRPGAIADPGAWAENVVAAMAFYKSGRLRDGNNLAKAQKASAEWIRATSDAVNRALGACPGPYAAETKAFLFKHESVAAPLPAIRKCGDAYLREFTGFAGRCKAVAGALKREWEEFHRDHFARTAEVLRIDDFGKAMLCRKKSARTILTRFADRPTLLLGEGACDGEKPVAPAEFVREAIPKALRAKLDAHGCLPAPVSAEREETTGVGGLSSGSSDVQLVD